MYYLVHTLHFDSVKFVESCVKLEKRVGSILRIYFKTFLNILFNLKLKLKL
jgi:hypothetical protein